MHRFPGSSLTVVGVVASGERCWGPSLRVKIPFTLAQQEFSTVYRNIIFSFLLKTLVFTKTH